MLTWWQGYIATAGSARAKTSSTNSPYQQIATVKAGNGHKADLHDFLITPQDTALITVFNPVY